VRVLITATSLRPAYGGPAYSVARLAASLAEAGAAVALWAADGSVADMIPAPGAAGVTRLQGALPRAFDAFAPEVIHDNGLWLPHNHRVAELTREAGLPRVVSVRGMLEPWAVRHKRWKKAAAWRLYQRRDLDRAATLHATAAEEAENLHAFGLRPPIRVIANGVDVPELPQPSPDDQGGSRTALFLGRLYPVKGLPMLIEAWARTRPAGWRLAIAGPDEAGHRRELEAAVAAHSLGDVVSFPGPVADAAKSALLRDAELVVAPSLSESFGLSIAEALAHSTPVLTTTAAPWPTLESRGCGWRVAPTADALAEALRRATACDVATLRIMGAAGRALVAADYGWAGIAAAFLKLYGDLAGGGQRAAAAA
jgi:glycosyltransferase involved in cell wall biosynthesis